MATYRLKTHIFTPSM